MPSLLQKKLNCISFCVPSLHQHVVYKHSLTVCQVFHGTNIFVAGATDKGQ